MGNEADSSSTGKLCCLSPTYCRSSSLPGIVPLHWERASRDAPCSEQLSACPGKGENHAQGGNVLAMPCRWMETHSSVSICPIWCSGGFGQARQVPWEEQCNRRHRTWEIRVRLVLHQVPQSPCHFPKRMCRAARGTRFLRSRAWSLGLCWISDSLLWDDSSKSLVSHPSQMYLNPNTSLAMSCRTSEVTSVTLGLSSFSSCYQTQRTHLHVRDATVSGTVQMLPTSPWV